MRLSKLLGLCDASFQKPPPSLDDHVVDAAVIYFVKFPHLGQMDDTDSNLPS